MAKKLSKTQQWMIDHPGDVPCPREPGAARSWRMKRGLDATWKQRMRRAEALAKYDSIMAEMRRAAALG